MSLLKILILASSLVFFTSCSSLGKRHCCKKQQMHKHHHQGKQCSKCTKNKKCEKCTKGKQCSKCTKNKKCSKCHKQNKKCEKCTKGKQCSKCTKNKKCEKCTKGKQCSKCHKNKKCSKCDKNKKCSKCDKNKKCEKCTKNKKCSKCHKNKKCNKKGCKIEHKDRLGNVIFVHPDGMSLSHWDAIRLYHKGLNKKLHYDSLPHAAIYRGTIRGQVTATSNAGGTIHAYGIKTGKDSFGMDQKKKILSLSQKPYSLLIEAKKKGLATALCQSGSIVEPGTAAFVAQVSSRKSDDEIARQVIESGVDLIFAGGEKFLLPQEVKGRFGRGVRKDNLNLISTAKKMGYTVIYDLKDFDRYLNDKKILGIFSHDHTFNSLPEEEIRKKRLPYYSRRAPTIAQMTQSALRFLENKKKKFFIVVEEEGTDNFPNLKNVNGFLEAGKRADDTLGVTQDFLKKNPQTLLVTTSDSNSGGLIISENRYVGDSPLYSKKSTYEKYPFSIVWGSPKAKDAHGGILVKAAGFNSHLVQGLMENTDIYKLIYKTLFNKDI